MTGTDIAARTGAVDFAASHAADPDWRIAAETCALGLPGPEEGFTLGFAYVTEAHAGAFAQITEVLRARTGIEDWVGTVGLGVCASGVELFDVPALSVLAAKLPPGAASLIEPVAHPNQAKGAAEGVAAGLGVVHADPRNQRAQAIVSALASASGSYLVGGLAAAGASFPQLARRIVEGGVSGVFLGAEIPVAVGLTQGCSPIGPVHTVTLAERQVVARLDDEPALQVLREDLGIADEVHDPRPWLDGVHAALPIAGSDTGDYLVRNIVGIEPTNGLVVIADEVSEGDRLVYVRRDPASAEKDLARMLAQLKARAGGTPKGGLYFSCVARGPNTFARPSQELETIRVAFGDFPLAGFFGNGEICHDRIYGYTGVLALFL